MSYLIVGTDPNHKWRLAPEADIDQVDADLRARADGIVVVPVTVEGRKAMLNVDRSKLTAWAIIPAQSAPTKVSVPQGRIPVRDRKP